MTVILINLAILAVVLITLAVSLNTRREQRRHLHMERALMADLSKLAVAVAGLEQANAALVQLAKDLFAALQAAQGGSTDQAALDALAARVDAVTQADAAEVAADTPATPAP